MDSRKKSQCRVIADFIITYGVTPGPIDYETFVGLIFLRDRSRRQKSYDVAVGVSVGNSFEMVSWEMVRAVCETDGEADELMYKINAARERAKLGWK